jgi:murein DD-endopeptidase MepM/ murein hydrolase activator NlpD
MPAKQKSGIGAAGGRLFCWPRMRTAALAAAFIVLLAPDALANKPQARRPWLLFPIDVRRFDHVSSRFGMRRLAGHRQLHRGVDLVAPSGSWVVAAREGRVAEAGRARACGWYVTVVHANAWRTIYCHLKSDPRTLGIVQGLAVPAMGVVGEVGSTGHSTGPHLHFSLLDEAGQARDPLRSLYTPAETLQVLRHMGLAR